MEKIGVFKSLRGRISANGPGLTLAIVAMVVALTGGAFAAAGSLTGKQKKEVTKIAKKFAGKPGASGAKGDPGPQGSPGAQGAKGDQGIQGDPGQNGEDGDDGESVTVTPIAAGDPFECEEQGGALVKETNAPSGVEVCNGKEGDKGDPGDPWTAGGTLPANGMVTGMWMASGTGLVSTPLSFAIPLAGNVLAANVFYGSGTEEPEIEVSPGVFEKTVFQKNCLNSLGQGTAANPQVAPTANPRTLCVFFNQAQSTAHTFESVTRGKFGEAAGTWRAGGILNLNITTPGVVVGAYAVKGG